MVRMILVNMQNFKSMAFLLLEICHKNFLSRMQRVTAIRYLPPGIKQNSTKITFMPEIIFPGTNLYPSLHFHGFEAKQKNLYDQFF